MSDLAERLRNAIKQAKSLYGMPPHFERELSDIGNEIEATLSLPVQPVAWPEGFFKLGGDNRLRECASDGCHQHVSIRVERGGVGSDHCEPCARKIADLLATPPVPPTKGPEDDLIAEKVTPEALRDDLLSVFRGIAVYWANLPDVDKATGHPLTVEGRCDGVVFSILSQLDGVGQLPAFDLVSHVHPDDEDQSLEGVVISDMLHEHYGSALRSRPASALPVVGEAPIICDVLTMQHTSSFPDHFTRITKGERSLTMFMSKIKGQCEYHAAELNWLLNGAEKPDLMAFDYTEPEGLAEYRSALTPSVQP